MPAATAAAAQRLRSFIHIPHKLHSDFEIAAAAAGRAQKADILEAGLGADCMMVDSLHKKEGTKHHHWPIVNTHLIVPVPVMKICGEKVKLAYTKA